MAAKQLQFDEAIGTFFAGSGETANGRLRPLGYVGPQWILDKKFREPRRSRKDGVTVEKEIELKTHTRTWELVVREVASKPSEFAGDGTTTGNSLRIDLVKVCGPARGCKPDVLQVELERPLKR